jgi:DNA-binding MarR family transcriptional regulator
VDFYKHFVDKSTKAYYNKVDKSIKYKGCESLQEDIMSLVKLNNKIFRATQVYLDKVLKKYDLSSGSYPYLLILRDNEGISQNKISEELGKDKAMSARTITKLVKLGYLQRQEDEADARAYKLYLTEKAKNIIPKIVDEIHNLISLITIDLSEEAKTCTIDSLDKALENIKKL